MNIQFGKYRNKPYKFILDLEPTYIDWLLKQPWFSSNYLDHYEHCKHLLKNNIIDYIGHPERIFPIGRLDKDSQGLILLTNDGDIVNKILRSRNNHQKEYIVRVDKPITNDFIQRMSNGVPILDTITKKCYVNKISNFEFKIILTQGLNRQIRRMCEVLKYKVKKLKRIRIMNIHLNVDLGKWRNLEKKELNELNRLCKESHKTI